MGKVRVMDWGKESRDCCKARRMRGKERVGLVKARVRRGGVGLCESEE